MAIIWQNKDKTTWDAEINAWIFDDIQASILDRLYPNSLFEYDISITSESEEALYDLISPYQLAGETRIYDTKLDWDPNVLDEMALYKSEHLVDIDRRFRCLGLHNWKASADMTSTLDTYNNFALFTEKIVKDEMETELAIIEAQDALLLSEDTFQREVDEKVKRIALGVRIVATINKMNDDASITGTQLTAILSDTDILNALQAFNTGSLLTGQAIITAKDISGLAPLSQAHKDRVNSMVDNYLGV